MENKYLIINVRYNIPSFLKGSLKALKALISIISLTLMVFAVILLLSKPTIHIIDTPISFSQKRVDLTQAYIKEHYSLNVSHINIDPKMIVLHWTEDANTSRSFELFNEEHLSKHAQNVKDAGQLNVSAHFLIDREGHIFRLMPETLMARHVIGLNYHAIGIENIGGVPKEGVAQADLTPAQKKANIELITYLKKKYSKIEYLIGHYEYREFEDHPLWMEKDIHYRTLKNDPDPQFLQDVYRAVKDLGLKRAP